MEQRRREADEFYAALTPAGRSADEAAVLRQAFAGMLWTKQYYHYDVERWLDGDPAFPPPPAARREGRNHDWRHLNNRDVLSMPDKWEYPWYAAWDLAFHCVALAHVDPEFAKSQLMLICREWYMHPNGQLPAYEWDFSRREPAGARLGRAARLRDRRATSDYDFLERVFHKLILNFTWWVNRKDAEGRNIFEGGFLGLDNIGVFDRSAPPPVAGRLEQADGTAWMAMYCLDLLEIALTLADHDDTYEDVATKFFEHFTLIAVAMNRSGTVGRGGRLLLRHHPRRRWHRDPDAGALDGGAGPAVRGHGAGARGARQAATTSERGWRGSPRTSRRCRAWSSTATSPATATASCSRSSTPRSCAGCSPACWTRGVPRPHGLRSVSRYQRDHPFVLSFPGGRVARVDYEPAESRTGLFGGNSNWRGPVWFPLNHLVVQGLRRFHAYLGDDFTVECPTGSGRQLNLGAVADEICPGWSPSSCDAERRRPVFGSDELFQRDPAWHDLLLFHEYFHGDTARPRGVPPDRLDRPGGGHAGGAADTAAFSTWIAA